MTEEERLSAQAAFQQAAESYREAHKLRTALSSLVGIVRQRGIENHLAEGFAAVIERKLT